MNLREAAMQALLAIEQGQSFDHLDNVVAPALRLALEKEYRSTKRTVTYVCPVCAASLERQE
jgi:hypothetical protein